MIRIVLMAFAIAAMALAAGCSTVSKRVAALPSYTDAPSITAMKVPYPILLLHGLGQKADVWEGDASAYYARDLGLAFGGTLQPRGTTLSPPITGGAEADYYVVQFSNPVDSVGAWATELEQCIRYVRQHTGADRVIVIGYSMGGLAARSYLTRRLTNHNVKRLITIGTPHLGSPFARVWTWKSKIQEGASSSNPLLSLPAKAALNAIQGAEGDVPFDAPAVRDLRRPEDGGEFLRRLGKMAHPLDVEYVSVIGNLNLFNEAQRLSEGFIQDLLRRLLSIDNGLPELFTPGDGVVSTASQDVMNVEYFAGDAQRKRAARTVTVPTVHVDHLRKSKDVQRITMDEKPEFKGAEIYRRGNEAVLVVDMSDHIPGQCTVVVDVECDGTSSRIQRNNADVHLVRNNGAIIARVVIPISDVACTHTGPSTMRITIRNTFGHEVTAQKEWR